MDFVGNGGAPVRRVSAYSQLSDTQLRSAIRFTRAYLQSIEEEQAVLRRAYNDEIAIMRGELVDRLIARIMTRTGPLSPEQWRELLRRFESHALPTAHITALVRSASRGRTDDVGALSEIEAMAILLRLEPSI